MKTAVVVTVAAPVAATIAVCAGSYPDTL